jgi:hypothetical protein
MFYEVKILDPQGKVKKVLSRQELGKRHWKDFFIANAEKRKASINNLRVPGWLKKKLDLEYAPLGKRSIAY